jgi:peptide/nickel transport system permease protein
MKRKSTYLNGYFIAGAILTGFMAALIILGYFWTPYDPNAMISEKFLSPSLQHFMGTDNFGRDIFSRVMQGAGTTFGIALATVAIGAVCGTFLGALTGYFGGLVDEILMRLGDVLTAFPSILLALVIISIMGPGKTYNVVLALGLVFIPSFARVTRTAYAGLRDANYIKSARLMGASNARILWVHILPNILSTLLPAITIGFNNAVLAEASMSYLGIGVTPPDASLGYMLSEAQGMLTRAPWYALGTGLVIVLLIFGVGLLGEGLQRRGNEVA